MMGPSRWSMARWAARDVLRRPGRSALLAGSLALLAAVAASPLLLTQALSDTAQVLLAAGPSLVVRRVDAGGWAPLPGAEASERARAVVGVLAATPRVWGVVRAPDGPVTVVGIEPSPSPRPAGAEPRRPMASSIAWADAPEFGRWLGELPAGSAIVGPGLAHLRSGAALLLRGAVPLELAVVGTLGPELSMAAHDVVLVRADDARRLLGLAPGQASDLAIDVFHDQEAAAVASPLAAAFPWPVQLSQRADRAGSFTGALARRGGLAMVALVPAVLAWALLVVGVWRDGQGRRRELGLLRALGWTTGDLVRLRLYRELCVAVPAVAVGLAVAYRITFWPGVRWPGELLLGWSGDAARLSLLPTGALLILLEVASMVLVPYLAASVLSILRAAGADPAQQLAGDAG